MDRAQRGALPLALQLLAAFFVAECALGALEQRPGSSCAVASARLAALRAQLSAAAPAWPRLEAEGRGLAEQAGNVLASLPAILDDLARLEGALAVRLAMEEALEQSEARRRAEQRRSPFPTAVPRLFEAAAARVEPHALPRDAAALLRADRQRDLEAASRARRGKRGQTTSRGTPASATVKIAVSGPGDEPSPSPATATANAASGGFGLLDLFRARSRLAVMRASALRAMRLHNVGAIEDFRGHIVRLFSPTLAEFLASAVGVSVSDEHASQESGGGGGGSFRAPQGGTWTEQAVNMRDPDRAKTKAKAAETPATYGDAGESYAIGGYDDPNLFNIGPALWRAPWAEAAADELAPGTAGGRAAGKGSGRPRLAYDQVLVDPSKLASRYGLDGKGAQVGSSLVWRRHTGFFRPIINARTRDEALQVLAVRLLQVVGLAVTPARACIWEAPRLAVRLGARLGALLVPRAASRLLSGLASESSLLSRFASAGAAVVDALHMRVLGPVGLALRALQLDWAAGVVWGTADELWSVLAGHRIAGDADAYVRSEAVACREAARLLAESRSELEALGAEAAAVAAAVSGDSGTVALWGHLDLASGTLVAASPASTAAWAVLAAAPCSETDLVVDEARAGAQLQRLSLCPMRNASLGGGVPLTWVGWRARLRHRVGTDADMCEWRPADGAPAAPAADTEKDKPLSAGEEEVRRRMGSQWRRQPPVKERRELLSAAAVQLLAEDLTALPRDMVYLGPDCEEPDAVTIKDAGADDVEAAAAAAVLQPQPPWLLSRWWQAARRSPPRRRHELRVRVECAAAAEHRLAAARRRGGCHVEAVLRSPLGCGGAAAVAAADELWRAVGAQVE